MANHSIETEIEVSVRLELADPFVVMFDSALG